MDSSANIYVAWHESGSSGSQVYVRRAAAPGYGGWIELDGDNGTVNPLDRDAAMPTLNPSILIRAGDAAAVAWQEWEVASSGYVILVAEWNGSGWPLIGGGKVNLADTADQPSLTTDLAGRLVVAYRQRVSGSPASLMVSRHIGGAWVELGGPLNVVSGYEIGEFPKLAVNSSGAIYAVWTEGDYTDGYSVYVKRYNQ